MDNEEPNGTRTTRTTQTSVKDRQVINVATSRPASTPLPFYFSIFMTVLLFIRTVFSKSERINSIWTAIGRAFKDDSADESTKKEVELSTTGVETSTAVTSRLAGSSNAPPPPDELQSHREYNNTAAITSDDIIITAAAAASITIDIPAADCSTTAAFFQFPSLEPPPAYSVDAPLSPYPEGAGGPCPAPAYSRYPEAGEMVFHPPPPPPGFGVPNFPGAIADPPPDYMIFSMLNCIFCCWVFGMIAMLRSSHVRSAVKYGNYELAFYNSQSARLWNLAALVTGALLWTLGTVALVIICYL